MLFCSIFLLTRSGLHLDRSSVSFYFCLHLPPWAKWTLDLVCSFAFPCAVDIHLYQLLMVPTIVRLHETSLAHESRSALGASSAQGLLSLQGSLAAPWHSDTSNLLKLSCQRSIYQSELLWCLIMWMWNKTIFHRTQSIDVIAIHANAGRTMAQLARLQNNFRMIPFREIY